MLLKARGDSILIDFDLDIQFFFFCSLQLSTISCKPIYNNYLITIKKSHIKNQLILTLFNDHYFNNKNLNIKIQSFINKTTPPAPSTIISLNIFN